MGLAGIVLFGRRVTEVLPPERELVELPSTFTPLCGITLTGVREKERPVAAACD